MRKALTIAGSDSGGGAGIQADLKTFAALGVYGLSAITAITAQDTQAVHRIFSLPADLVAAQIDAVAEDIGVDAVKTGMLPTARIVEVVAGKVRELRLPNLVIDPVVVASSGRRLVRAKVREALIRELLPLARVITPNLAEAEALTGLTVCSIGEMKEAARALYRLGTPNVVVKGGHLAGEELVDILFDGLHLREYPHPRIPTRNTHGTGCTFSAALAAGLAKGLAVEEALEGAEGFVAQALALGAELRLGKGRGPLDHLGGLYRAAGLTIVE